jgi:hypothetical protein
VRVTEKTRMARRGSRERLNNWTYRSAIFTGNSKRRSGELVKGLFIPQRCRAWLRLFAVDLIESRSE